MTYDYDGDILYHISRICKNKNIAVSKVIENLLSKYIENNYNIKKSNIKISSQRKTLRLDKVLFDEINKKDVGFGLSCIVNNLIEMLIKGDISIEDK